MVFMQKFGGRGVPAERCCSECGVNLKTVRNVLHMYTENAFTNGWRELWTMSLNGRSIDPS